MEGASPLPLAARLQQRVGEQAGSAVPPTALCPPEPEPEPEQLLDDERSQRPRDAAMETRETPPKRRPPGHLEPRQLGLPPPSSPPPSSPPPRSPPAAGQPCHSHPGGAPLGPPKMSSFTSLISRAPRPHSSKSAPRPLSAMR